MISTYASRALQDSLRDHRDKAKLLKENAQKELDNLTKAGKYDQAYGTIAKLNLFEGMFQAYDDALYQVRGWDTDD